MSIEIKNQKFNVIEKLGKENLERNVYKVESEIDQNIYIIKKIGILGLKEEEKNKIMNEAKILENINHKNIVKLIDYDQDKEYFYILMEYCKGSDLEKFIKMHKEKNEKIKESIIYNIVLGICLGLEEIHKKNIIHRDIKPVNIIIGDNYQIKIVDFGISKKIKNNNILTKYIGTSYYMAPEIIKGEEYNKKVDIWAFGCIIYELLTLKVCFQDENLLALYNKIIYGTHENINLKDYNPKWKELVDLLLKKNYNERPDIKEIKNIIPKIDGTINIIKIEKINRKIAFLMIASRIGKRNVDEILDKNLDIKSKN